MTVYTDAHVPTWLIIAHLFELLINCISIFVGFLSFRTIVKHRLFHWNLRLLMNIMSVGWITMLGSRIASLIQQFICPHGMLGSYILLLEWPFVILEYLRAFGCSIVVYGCSIGIIERIFASILLDTYQHKTHTGYILAVMVGGLPISIICTYYCLTIEYGFIISIIAGITGALLFIIFVSVDRWNKRRLEMSIKFGINYTLNQRFQLSENIRSAALVYRASAFGSFGSVIAVALILIYNVLDNDTHIYILRVVFNIYVAFYTLAFSIIFVTQPTIWRSEFSRQLQQFCPRFFYRNRVSPVTIEDGRARVQNLDGLQLEFSPDEERHLYFQQLAHAWK